jgi:hypothetical protein
VLGAADACTYYHSRWVRDSVMEQTIMHNSANFCRSLSVRSNIESKQQVFNCIDMQLNQGVVRPVYSKEEAEHRSSSNHGGTLHSLLDPHRGDHHSHTA